MPLLYKIGVSTIKPKINHELFESDLVRLNSITKITRYIDSLYQMGHSTFDTASYVNLTSEITAKRFYFGLSNYNFSENWIAYLCGKLIWHHFMAIVEPNDILKYPEGLCSQQTIVFIEILRKKGINVRTVGFGKKEGPGHFLCEVWYDADWHLYDVTKEPVWPENVKKNQSFAYYLNHKDELFWAYSGILSRDHFDKLITNVEYGKVNSFPAKKMLFFHKTTYILTYAIPFLLGLLLLNSIYKFRRDRQKP